VGGRDFLNPEHRSEVARELEIPMEKIPARDSWAYDQIVDGIRDGKIKGLWVIATNSSHSWIHQSAFNELLAKLDFLVVQDMYPTTETAQRADLYLPAAGWGEKEGTFINSERRIGLVKKVCRAPGRALADFHIFQLIAAYWGCGELFRKWRSPEAAFQMLKKLAHCRPCDISGIRDYGMLDECGGIQWPFTANDESRMTNGETDADDGSSIIRDSLLKERRLFEDGKFFTPDGRAKFIFDEPRPVAEPTDLEFPFVLLTGRGTSAQWHTGSRTNKSDVLSALAPKKCYVEVNPSDAARLRIAPNAKVRIRSRRASIVANAFVTPTVQSGQIFIPMHYAEVNRLTHPSFDPHSRQPNYKHCAVDIAPARKRVHLI
jgi:assimilatory nitrate reductase catalytic subunit